MDELFCMRVFSRVVELGSFARAADSLDIARPGATTAVARLEKRLGVRLLNRTTRQLSLTDDGRVYYAGCVRILGELAQTEEQLSSARRSPRGRLRVSVPNSFIHITFLPAVPRFLARYPEIDLEIVMTDRAVNLVEEGIDCAVRGVDIPGDSTLVARRVADVRLLTCASPEYLARHGEPATIEALGAHNCIRFISLSTGRLTEWRFEKDGVRRSFAPRGNLGVTSMEGAGMAAAHGVGIAQVSEVLARPLLAAGRLQPILRDWVAPAPPLNVVYPSNRYLTAKVRAFADFVSELYGRPGAQGDPARGASR
ncbi:MAG TPA: LysR family transcriptional regulator [Burkholderiales bacterium]|nr:LysR family transcriptional regulator [Burkholderiales bacterium]